MKKIILTILLLFGVLNLLNSSVLANEKKVLKAGTYIPIVFDESISSKTAKPNQTVHIKVASDVTVGNVKFFNQNDKGIIYIKKVVPARKFSKAGRLEFGGKEYNGKK